MIAINCPSCGVLLKQEKRNLTIVKRHESILNDYSTADCDGSGALILSKKDIQLFLDVLKSENGIKMLEEMQEEIDNAE